MEASVVPRPQPWREFQRKGLQIVAPLPRRLCAAARENTAAAMQREAVDLTTPQTTTRYGGHIPRGATGVPTLKVGPARHCASGAVGCRATLRRGIGKGERERCHPQP